MILSNRIKISLRQLLGIIDRGVVYEILKNRNITNTDNTWGSALKTLQTKNFLSEKEEKFMATTYTLISDGAHTLLGFDDSEYVRFCRNQAIAQCYYIIKKYNKY